jgi:serine protease Do
MKPLRIAAAVALLGCNLGVCHRANAGGPENERRTPIVQACERVKGAIVNIHSERSTRLTTEDVFMPGSPKAASGMGTGIIIDPRGLIVTNQHVVDNVDVIRVHLSDGSSHAARVIARDKETDLALLKIDVSHPLATIPFGTSSDLMVGEPVIAIGNAFGYEHTVTTGIVSYKGRDVSLNKELSYKALIQTNAAINPGNSGGPLLNIQGDLIGVNVAIRAGAQGIGFAIPVDTMLRVTAELLRKRNGFSLGLACRDQVGESEAEFVSLRTGSKDKPVSTLLGTTGLGRWLMIERVEAGSVAQRAGLEAGDVVVKVDGQAIACNLELERALLEKRGGESVGILVRRKGAEKRLDLVLQQAERTAASAADVVWRRLGLKLETVSPEVVARLDDTHTLHGGLLVSDVERASAAGRVGVMRGDILVGLIGYETITIDNVTYVLTHAEQNKMRTLVFWVIRNGKLHSGSLDFDVRSE